MNAIQIEEECVGGASNIVYLPLQGKFPFFTSEQEARVRELIQGQVAYCDREFGKNWRSKITRPVLIKSNNDNLIAQIVGDYLRGAMDAPDDEEFALLFDAKLSLGELRYAEYLLNNKIFNRKAV
ncbi:MAG: hypothetical protein WDZ88_00720 [Candidatus Paceibacterota bacterium]